MVAQRADENIRENSSKKKAAVGNDAVEHTEKAEVAQALFLWDTADVPNLQPRSDQRVNKLCGAEQHANDGQQRFNGKPAHRNKRNHQQIDGVRGGAQKGAFSIKHRASHAGLRHAAQRLVIFLAVGGQHFVEIRHKAVVHIAAQRMGVEMVVISL